MRPEALSPDGYIINQDLTDDIPYGRTPSDYSGCGWIAAYNFFKATGRPKSVEEVSTALATGWFKGRAGTGPFRLKRYLQKQGYTLKTAFRRKKTFALAREAKNGILLYFSADALHFVAFTATDQPGKLRFFNAESGNAAHCDTMAGFFANQLKSPLHYIMVTS